MPVEREMLMCKPHWLKVPKPIQLDVWDTYRTGQCNDMKPSVAYCKAASEAVKAVAVAEGIEPDLRLYNLLAVAAERREANPE